MTEGKPLMAKELATRAEWNAWRDLCERLKEAGLVTDKDLNSKVTENNTKGQKVFDAIRNWGKLFAEMRNFEKKEEKCASSSTS